LNREIAELAKRIEQYEQQRQRSIQLLSNLKDKWQRKEISYEEYKRLLETRSNGKTIYQWVEFYNHWIKIWNKEIDNIRSSGMRRPIVSRIFSLAIVLLLVLVLFYLGSFITSFVIREETKVYSESLNLEFFNSGEYVWEIKNPGNLDFVKISGEIEGDGRVKVYLDNLLLFDSRYLDEFELDKDETFGLTSKVIYEKEIVDENVSQSLIENDSVVDIEIEEKTKAISEEISIIEFLDICEETCNLSSLDLNKESYIVRVEIENVSMNAGILDVKVLNSGNTHFMVTGIHVQGFDASGNASFERDIGGWYLLSGMEKVYSTRIPPEVCRGIRNLNIEVQTKETTLTQQLPLEGDLCGNPAETAENR